MPLHKYYCDYCDKQFQDTPSAITSVPDPSGSTLSSEPNQVLAADAFSRGVCKRFFKTGFCRYGDSCKYVHSKDVASPGTITPGNVLSSCVGMAWDNIPASLGPPPDGAYGPQPFVDWG